MDIVHGTAPLFFSFSPSFYFFILFLSSMPIFTLFHMRTFLSIHVPYTHNIISLFNGTSVIYYYYYDDHDILCFYCTNARIPQHKPSQPCIFHMVRTMVHHFKNERRCIRPCPHPGVPTTQYVFASSLLTSRFKTFNDPPGRQSIFLWVYFPSQGQEIRLQTNSCFPT